jgi:hypothetical protein
MGPLRNHLEPHHDDFSQISSPAKPLPVNRKRPSNGTLSSPRGIENSPNSRPRKVARMPRIVGLGPSPLKSLVRYQQPAIRSDALSGPQVTKGEAGEKNFGLLSTVEPETLSSLACVAVCVNGITGTVLASPLVKFFSPAKVPVGSQTPFRYGTNRILDVPLSAVKKGGRWVFVPDGLIDMLECDVFGRSTGFFGDAASKSESSDKSDASDQRPPFLTAERGTSKHSSMSINPSGTKTEEGRHALNETAKNLELVFLEEDSPECTIRAADVFCGTALRDFSSGYLASVPVEGGIFG